MNPSLPNEEQAPISQRLNPPWLTFVLAAPKLISAALLAAALWYGYFVIGNLRYQGVIHWHGSMLILATLTGGLAWLLNAVCLRRGRWYAGCVCAAVGIGCFLWISTLT